ncbi:TIGR02265 family protein [Archangium lansingense]|uniref:TIGR02265 family protein n=1 Tax=Archangium lansingense TaxID=2995310 RepID=A0ABT4AQ57_9BACT|nr:TIGR02265 family protein [Archangium lansinium]MCY1083299.1 TIGR02265 family protein [Archangium lansinium]
MKLIPLGDTVRGYFFHCALEQVRLLGDEEALRRCREAGGLESPMRFFKYPISGFVRLLYEAARALTDSAGSFEEAMRQLGRHVATEFLGSPVGKTMLLLAGDNLQRLADSLPMVYRTGWGHGVGEVAWTGFSSCRTSIHGNVIPFPYFEGIFLEVFQAAGATHLKVAGRQVGPADTEYELSWELRNLPR